MLLRLRGVLAGLFVFGLLAGCDGPTMLELDGGRPDAAPGALGTITIVGEGAVALTPRARATIIARWTDADGRLVVDRDVSFALDGMPRDSSLFSLVARTDASGEAEGMVIAGEQAATFRVRVAAPGATPAYVDVAVGAEGFGRLSITVEGGDERTIARRTVRLHQGAVASTEPVRCADALGRADADRTRTVGETGVVELTALPAGQLFTVVARAENARGTVVAEGCVEGVRVEMDREIRRTITLVARQLGVEGEYDTGIELSPESSPRAAIETLRTALDAAVLASGGDATLMLDGLDAELRERGDTALADALAAERLTGDPDTTLALRLDVGGAAPTSAVSALLGQVGTLTDAIAIDGTLAIARAAPEGSLASFTRESVIVGAVGAGRVSADLGALGVEARTPAAMRYLGDVDRLEIDELAIGLPLGRLVAGTIDGIVRARGASAPAELVIDASGCTVLDAWIDERPDLATACDDACAIEVCTRAVEAVLAILQTAAAPLDDVRARLVLSGEITSDDVDGDLAVDAFRAGVISGGWISADGATSEPVDGSFSGTRVSPLP